MIFADAQRGEGQVQKVCCSASSRQTQAMRQIPRVEMSHSRFQLRFAPVRNHCDHKQLTHRMQIMCPEALHPRGPATRGTLSSLVCLSIFNINLIIFHKNEMCSIAISVCGFACRVFPVRAQLSNTNIAINTEASSEKKEIHVRKQQGSHEECGSGNVSSSERRNKKSDGNPYSRYGI